MGISRWVSGAESIVVPLGDGPVEASLIRFQAHATRIRVGHLSHDASSAGF